MKDYIGIAGKVAIVTGSGQGIGEAIAKAFAEYGAKVMVNGAGAVNGKKVMEEIRAAGGTAEFCQADVTKIEEVKKLVQATVDAFGTIDILVNNAGGGDVPTNFFDLTDEAWDKSLKFNLYSQFYMIRECFPYMKEHGGKIVNISSGYAICGGDWCADYASAKAGVIGLTSSIAKEVAPYHINCNVIVAPTTDTPGLRASDFELVDDEIPLIPQGRIANVKDISDAALYLVSQSSEYVTGQILAPNGGRRMLV